MQPLGAYTEEYQRVIGWMRYEVLGFTVEELRRLMEKRSVLLKMLQRPNADQEVIAGAKRHASADVVRLDDFRERSG